MHSEMAGVAGSEGQGNPRRSLIYKCFALTVSIAQGCGEDDRKLIKRLGIVSGGLQTSLWCHF